MKIYDLSQELFSSRVFPGDPHPSCRAVARIEDGSTYNLTELVLGSHSGTHMDAPFHFCQDGRPIDRVELEKCVGLCKVVRAKGRLSPEWVEAALADGSKRLLIVGNIEISLEAARKMTELGLWFLGVEGLTVGPMDAPAAVHAELLGHEVVILEAAVLEKVPEGSYFLVSPPMKYGGLDGAQARPLLLEFEQGDSVPRIC